MNVEDFKTKQMVKEMSESEDILFEDGRSLNEIIQEIADEEGMSFEHTMAMFRKGIKDANNMLNKKTSKDKEKFKKKRKEARASKKRNRQ